MMRILNFTISKKSLFLAGINLLLCHSLAGCQVSQQPGAQAPAAKATADSTPLDGPGHTGGGNGFDLKVYEEYIVDPTSNPSLQPAFNLLKPILAQMQLDYKNRYGTDPNSNQIFTDLFHFKTWYLLPQHLKVIPNQTLGILSDDSSEQYALQTDTAILIDATYFKQMRVEDQAQLLLHEYVMNLFLLKYISFQDLCNFSYRVEGNKCYDGNAAGMAILDEYYQPTPARPLDTNDYDDIRNVTSQLWSSGAIISTKDLPVLLLSHHFDARFFSQDLGPMNTGTQASLSLTNDQLKDLLLKAKYSNALPKICSAMTLKTQVNCHLDWSEDQETVPWAPAGTTAVSVLTIKLVNSDTGEILGSSSVYSSASSMGVYSVLSMGGADPLYSSTNFDIRFYLSNKTVGQKYDFLVLLFSLTPGKTLATGTWSDLSITSVATMPLVYLSEETTNTPVDSGHTKKCVTDHFTKIQPQVVGEDILANGDGRWTQFLATWITPDFANCNVLSTEPVPAPVTAPATAN